ncbi:MAG: alpha/beta hydrolase-fold protein, partial [Streptosporangiaceae bacterium]
MTRQAKVVLEQEWGPRRRDLFVDSPAMGRVTAVRIITPEGWSRTSTRRWPVLYLLHGGAGFYTGWSHNTDIEELSAAHGVIVVMPECGTVGGCTDWLIGPQWET